MKTAQEFKIQEQLPDGRWRTATTPIGTSTINTTFKTITEAEKFIRDHLNEDAFEKRNAMWPDDMKRERPVYRIVSRGVTPWMVVDIAYKL